MENLETLGDQKSIINLTQFEATIWTGPRAKGANIKKKTKKMTDNVIKSKRKCNLCGYVSSHAGHLNQHLKTHSGEKSNKCNQCDYASSQAGDLRKHLKTHNREKPNK